MSAVCGVGLGILHYDARSAPKWLNNVTRLDISAMDHHDEVDPAD